VVIPGDGRPRVVDFGLAKIIGVPEAVRPSGLDRPKPDPELDTILNGVRLEALRRYPGMLLGTH